MNELECEEWRDRASAAEQELETIIGELKRYTAVMTDNSHGPVIFRREVRAWLIDLLRG